MTRTSAALVLACVGFGLAGCSVASEVTGPAVVASGPTENTKKALEKFSRVSVSDAITCDISIGEPPSATISAATSIVPLIETRVDGNQLIIGLNRRVTINGPIKVKVVAPSLDALDASGASTVHAWDVQTSALDLTVSGSSNAVVDGHLGAGRLNASGASHVKLSGTGEEFSLGATGASIVDATNLALKKANVDASGASTVDVGDSDELSASASGASSVHYMGNPHVVSSNASDASTIAHG